MRRLLRRHDVAVAPRIAAAGQDAGLRIDGNALHAAHLHRPVGTGHDVVAALAQLGLDVGREAPLEQQAKTIRSLLRITVDEQRSWADEYAAWRHWRTAVEALGVLVLQQSATMSTSDR